MGQESQQLPLTVTAAFSDAWSAAKLTAYAKHLRRRRQVKQSFEGTRWLREENLATEGFTYQHLLIPGRRLFGLLQDYQP